MDKGRDKKGVQRYFSDFRQEEIFKLFLEERK
jgi:hypothetical protein